MKQMRTIHRSETSDVHRPDPLGPASRGEDLVLATPQSGITCVADGMRVDCAFVHRHALQCPDNDCGPRTRELVDRDGNHIGRVLTNPFQAGATSSGGLYSPKPTGEVKSGGFSVGGSWLAPRRVV